MKLLAIIDGYSEDYHALPDFKISLICKAPANTDEGRKLRKEFLEILTKHCCERKPLYLEISMDPMD